MKLEVGMYVRTKYNGIFNIQVLKTIKDINCDYIEINYINYPRNELLKASHNIIDLIEVGDVITFKNDNDVYKVICIPNKKHACDCFYLEFNYADKYGVEDIYVSKEDMEETLKSIITKEQFQNIEYRFGD